MISLPKFHDIAEKGLSMLVLNINVLSKDQLDIPE